MLSDKCLIKFCKFHAFFFMPVVICILYRWKRPIRSPSTPYQLRTVLQQTFIMVLLRLVSHAPKNEVSATSLETTVSEFIPLTYRKASPHFLQPISSLFICFFPLHTLLSIYCEVFPSVLPIIIAPPCSMVHGDF